jgi:hypothetical protein
MYDMDPNHVEKCQDEKNEAKGRLGEKRISASTLLLTALTTMGIFNFRGNTPYEQQCFLLQTPTLFELKIKKRMVVWFVNCYYLVASIF